MNNSHKHAHLFKAWAEGKTIQAKSGGGGWYDLKIELENAFEYRIKPTPIEASQKVTLYIYSNFADGKSWITPQKLNPEHENEKYCQYLGSIEVTK